MLTEKKLKISAIFEPDNKTLKESHQFRVDRTGYIVYAEINLPLIFAYEDGHGALRTSNIKEIKENNNGFTIITLNSIYILNYIKEE